ncbi:TPA: hypothetical protein H1009_03940 [archaeon]|nr:hypothetical protein [Candidatus Naiadarchaeales archaeon SRR2090153.bin461]
MEMQLEQKILKKLDKIEKEVEEIKAHMVDVDVILTEDEKKLLDESLVHEKEGSLVSLGEVENVRNKARQTA